MTIEEIAQIKNLEERSQAYREYAQMCRKLADALEQKMTISNAMNGLLEEYKEYIDYE